MSAAQDTIISPNSDPSISHDDKKDIETADSAQVPHLENDSGVAAEDSNWTAPAFKAPIIWNDGFHAFAASFKLRLQSIFTKRFIAVLFAGQLLSFCITATSVCTQELAMRKWALPTTQTFFNYFFLTLVFTPYTIYKYGFKGWFQMLYTDGWKYFILGAIDVEANYAVVKAYQYTDLLSAMLLDGLATPVAMFCAYFLVKARYHWTQLLGVIIAIAGLAMLVASDLIAQTHYEAVNKGLGDGLMILGASLYGVSNALEEFFIRKRPLYEVVGMLTFFATIINGVQAVSLEHNDWKHATWSGQNIGFLAAYNAALFVLYSLAPLIFRLSSSPFYNMSLLTSDFFGLLFGLALFGFRPYWLYFVAYVCVISGLIVYFSARSPEQQGKINVRGRGRVEQRGEGMVIGDGRIL